MITAEEIGYDIEDLIASIREKLGPRVTADKLGLDIRAGYSCDIHVLSDGIAVYGTNRNMEYYGGFEYVDREFVTRLGELTIYSNYDSRVERCINTYNGVECEEEEYETY